MLMARFNKERLKIIRKNLFKKKKKILRKKKIIGDFITRKHQINVPRLEIKFFSKLIISHYSLTLFNNKYAIKIQISTNVPPCEKT